MNNKEKIELHKSWWRRENTVPLVAPYIPVKSPYGGLDIVVPPSQIALRKKANAEVHGGLPGDALTVEEIHFGPAFLPALAGAGFEHDNHTSWSIPAFRSAVEATVRPFNPDHPLFVEYRCRLDPLLENWRWDSYLPGMADYLGPMDIAAGLLGPETLAVEMFDNPEAVRRLAGDAADFMAAVLDYELDLYRLAGIPGGVTENFSVWLPGRGARLSEDFSALVGPGQFEDFFIEADTRACRNCDHVFMHVHSAAWRNIPGFLKTQPIGAIEFGNDPNGPDLTTRLETARLIQSAGRALQFGSWEIPLPSTDIERIMKTLDQRGLLVRFQLRPGEDATEHIAWVKGIHRWSIPI